MSTLDMFRMFHVEPSFWEFYILAFVEQHRASLFLQVDEEGSLPPQAGRRQGACC